MLGRTVERSGPARGRWSWLIALLALCGLAADSRVGANELVADLSKHLIAITTAFVGADVVLFGTAPEGRDVVVTVTGPRAELSVRRKARLVGIWINRDEVVFDRAPAYYAVASSNPLDEIARAGVLARHELGVEHLRLEPIDERGVAPDEIAAFRTALIRNKQRAGLYSPEPGRITLLGPRLFRTTLHFPANTPPGIYQVQVLELDEGFAVGAQRSTLVVSKVGIEADIFDFAREQALLYGLTAIVLALASGWLANLIFRGR